MTPLFRRIGYEPQLEERAFTELAQSKPARCRETLTRLVDSLTLVNLPHEDTRRVVHLLLDLLHRVNHAVNGESDDPHCYQAVRIELIDAVASCEDAEPARLRFRERLGQLLDPQLERSPRLHPVVARAKSYIGGNYDRRVYLSTVAEHLHVSPNYLSRLFRRETGQTLTEYVQRVRLEEARQLLARGGRRISEIAYMVGYQNYRDFYRNFVKYEKAAPREVQRRLGSAARRAARAQAVRRSPTDGAGIS
jgi:two-component system response regulator YesN